MWRSEVVSLLYGLSKTEEFKDDSFIHLRAFQPSFTLRSLSYADYGGLLQWTQEFISPGNPKQEVTLVEEMHLWSNRLPGFFCWKASAQTIIIQWRINQIWRQRERWRREKRVVLTQHWLYLRGTVVQRHGPGFLLLSAPAADTNHIPANTMLLGTLEERRGREEDREREGDRQWGELTVSESQPKRETDCFPSLKHLECDRGISLLPRCEDQIVWD